MKKFTKIALIFASVMAGMGLICLIASVALGLTWDKFSDMVKDDKFNFSFYKEESEGFIATIEEECRELDIEFGAGVLEISYGDVEQIQVKQEDIRGFECYVEERTLHIEGGDGFGINDSEGTISIVIPQDMKFDEVDLEIGAGEAEIKGLLANTVNVEVGAGKANITALDVQNLNAEVGAGQLYAELAGSETDYNYDAECGIGEIQIGENSFGGLGNTKRNTNPGASRFMDIECGVGQIQIKFQK